jgi:hypothetical protein
VPNWQPNWQDVRWNYGAADRAASQLDVAANELDLTSVAQQQAARSGSAEWRGLHRQRFDQLFMNKLGDAWHVAGTFREAAARIRRATQWARDEQTFRERERERWRREKEDEERRAREDARRRREKLEIRS